MDKSDVMKIAGDLLSDGKTAVLSTVTPDNEPRMRWMSPVILNGRPDAIV